MPLHFAAITCFCYWGWGGVLVLVSCLFVLSLAFTILVSLQLSYCIRTVSTFRSHYIQSISHSKKPFGFAHSEDRAKGNAIYFITTSDYGLASGFLLCTLLLPDSQINEDLVEIHTAAQNSCLHHALSSSCLVWILLGVSIPLKWTSVQSAPLLIDIPRLLTEILISVCSAMSSFPPTFFRWRYYWMAFSAGWIRLATWKVVKKKFIHKMQTQRLVVSL